MDIQLPCARALYSILFVRQYSSIYASNSHSRDVDEVSCVFQHM